MRRKEILLGFNDLKILLQYLYLEPTKGTGKGRSNYYVACPAQRRSGGISTHEKPESDYCEGHRSICVF